MVEDQRFYYVGQLTKGTTFANVDYYNQIGVLVEYNMQSNYTSLSCLNLTLPPQSNANLTPSLLNITTDIPLF